MKKKNEDALETGDEKIQKEIRKSLDSALKAVQKNKSLKLENFQEFISLYGLDGYLELQSPSQPCWSKGKQTKIPISRPSEGGMVSYLVYSTPKGEKEAVKIIVHDLLEGGHLNLGKLYFLTHFLLKQRKYSKLAGTIANLLYLYNFLLEMKVSEEQRYKMVNESDYGRFLPEMKKLFKSREVFRKVEEYFTKELGDFLFTREESKNIDYDNLSFQKELRQVRKPIIPERKKGYTDKGHLPDPTKPKIDLEENSEISDHKYFWSEYVRNVLPEFKKFISKLLKETESKKSSKEES
jgi:hypothetical protein